MTVEEQLRDYRATLDAATDEAAVSGRARVAAPVRIHPVRTFAVAAAAVAAAVAVAFAVGTAHGRSTRAASTRPSTTASPITAVATPTTVAPASRIVTPDVLGMNSTRAVSTLRALGYRVQLTTTSQCEAPAGIVVAERPPPGTTVAAGSAVAISVCELAIASGTVTLPVAVCDTEYGVPPAASDPHAPATLTVTRPTFTTPKLSGYSDRRGYLPITAPAGWNCKALEAGDGGQAVGVTPPGVAPRESWGVGGTVTQPPTDGVFASAEPGCQGCVYDDVCAVVPGVGSQFPGHLPCPKAPAGEQVTPLGHDVYRIDDPAGALGPDVARSLLRFTPATATAGAGDVRETCILPAAEQAVCDAVLGDFVARHPS